MSELSAEKVAELEHRLAEAAAEVARVQAQLTQAQGRAPAGVPAATTTGPGPHAITVDGRSVEAGTGNLLRVLQGWGQGTTAPVVVINGQHLSGGQPVDLSSYLPPQSAERLRASLGALGLDHQYGALFGLPATGGAGGSAPPASAVAPLAEPPRPVPLSYRVATFDLSWYELFLLVILTAAPIAVWGFLPVTVPAALIAAVVVIALFRGRRYRRRIGALKWGKVATVTDRQTLSAGTYYGGTTYNNMRKRTASGWDMTTSWYSGPGYTNRVDFTVDGVPGTLKYRGLLYADGVVLADPRDTSRAMTVEQFPYHLRPGPDGRFDGRLGLGLWIGIGVTLVVELSLVGLAVLAVRGIWLG